MSDKDLANSEPVDLEQARVERAKAVTEGVSVEELAEREALAELAAQEKPVPAPVDEELRPAGPTEIEEQNPLALSVDQLAAAYGSAQIQANQLAAYATQLRAEIVKLRAQLKIKDEQLAVKQATIKNLAKKIVK